MSNLSPRRSTTAALALLAALSGTEALAQKPPEVGKADALFNAGRALLEAGEFADACPKFAESQKLAPGLGVTLYLADCYERLGKANAALVEFRRAVQIAASRGDKRGAIAAERATTLEEKIPLHVVVVTPAARAQGVTVTLDGEIVASSQWDVPTPIDPGEHEVVASAPSKVTKRHIAKLPSKKTTVTTVVDALEDTPPLPVAGPVPVVDTVVVPPSKTQKVIAITTGAVGIAGIGAGAVLGVLAMSKTSQSNDGPCNASDHCTPAGLSLRSDAVHLGNASTVAFVAGGVALGAGVVLYFTAPKAKRSTMGLEIDPVLSPGEVGLRARSTF